MSSLENDENAKMGEGFFEKLREAWWNERKVGNEELVEA